MSDLKEGWFQRCDNPLKYYSRFERAKIKEDINKGIDLQVLNLKRVISIIDEQNNKEESDMKTNVKVMSDSENKEFAITGLTQEQVDELYLVLGYVYPQNNSLLDVCGALELKVTDENYEMFSKVSMKKDIEYDGDFGLFFEKQV